MRRRGVGWSILIAAMVPAGAAPQDVAHPPELSTRRYDEDWSYLRDPAARAGAWWEPLKYQALGDDSYIGTGLEIRIRDEFVRNDVWGSADAPDDNRLFLRALPYADLHVGNVRFFAQLVASKAIGIDSGPGPPDDTGLDLLQGFAEAELPLRRRDRVTLRIGRQLVGYGSERLVGLRYGANVPLPFDGATAIWRTGDWRFDSFYLRPVRTGSGSLNDSSSGSRELWGLYAARHRPLGLPGGLDLYYLGYADDRAAFEQGEGSERRHTIGARLSGGWRSWSWNWEAMYQFGRFAGADISAWSVATETAYRIDGLPLNPRLRLRADVASGDRDRDDPDLQTFNALFPKAKYFGELSPVGPYNLMNLNPNVDFDFGRGFTFGLSGNWYWRESREDGVYDVPGHLIRPSGGSRARFVGTQLEAVLDWQVDANLDLLVSYSRMSAGRFVRETGPGEAIRQAGLEATWRF